MQLVERAALMCLKQIRDIRHIHKLCREFTSVTKMRNYLCHSQYEIDSTKKAVIGILSTDYQRQDFDGTNHQQFRTIDQGILNEIKQASRRAVSLCGRLASLAHVHDPT